MKQLLLCLFFPLLIQAQRYDKKWEKVVQLENEGKIKSAETAVSRIYRDASGAHDEPEIIKCFFYQSKYWMMIEEDAQTMIIRKLESELTRNSIATRSILLSIYADCVDKYLKIHPVNNIQICDDADFRTWNPDVAYSKLSEIVAKAVSPEAALKKIKLSQYDAIFYSGYRTTNDNSSLLEYLIRQQIGFLNRNLKADYSFRYNSERLDTEFLTASSGAFVSTDVYAIRNMKLKNLVVAFQRLESHFPSIENTLDRIRQLYGFTYSPDFYIGELKKLNAAARDTIDRQNIGLVIADQYHSQASKSYPDYNKFAMAYIDTVLAFANKSNAFKESNILRKKITASELSMDCREISYPGQNQLAHVEYTNVSELRLSYYRIPVKYLDTDKPKWWVHDSVAVKKKPLITQDYKLTDPGDYLRHTSEVVLPRLAAGTYLMVAEVKNDEGKVQRQLEKIQVTSLAPLIHRENNEIVYTILDRKTGTRKSDVAIKKGIQSTVSDARGCASLSYLTDNASELFTTAQDTLFIDRQYYSYYEKDRNRKFGQLKLYLDRHIYRPGQTVHFKGIGVSETLAETSVIKNTTFDVVIEDPEDGEIFRKRFKTSDFGSFSGSFDLPKSGLTGSFSIYAEEPKVARGKSDLVLTEAEDSFWNDVDFDTERINFSVEEYKRPTFDISFDTITDDLKLNEDVTISGKAKSFSQATLNNVTVRYSISEDYSHSNIINSGETTTNDQGKFSITFHPNDSTALDRETKISNRYTVNISITDAKGETQEVNTDFNVANHTLNLGVYTAATIASNEKQSVTISSNNINRNPKISTVKLQLFRLGDINNKPFTRAFPLPEFPAVSYAEFESLFPYETTGKPQVRDSVPIYESSFEANGVKTVPMDFLKTLKPGIYQIMASATDGLQTTTATTSFAYYKSGEIISDKLFTITPNVSKSQRNVIVASVIPNLEVQLSVFDKSGQVQQKTVRLEKGRYTYTAPSTVTNDISILAESVFENHHESDVIQLNALKEKPAPKLELITFRDRLMPGAPENWSFRITPDKDDSQAEILAAMYDESLDKFGSPSNWQKLPSTRYSIQKWTNSFFGNQHTYLHFVNRNLPRYELRNEKPELIQFGFDFTQVANPETILKYKNHLRKKAPRPKDSRLISGIVTESNLPFPGVEVSIRGSSRSAQTNIEGYYEIYARPNEELTFSFIGMQPYSHLVERDKEINVNLKPTESLLQEVNIINLGSDSTITKAKTATYSVLTTIIENQSFLTALQGTAAGVSISGAVGYADGTRIVIRGMGSNSNNEQPLIILDGVPVSADALRNLSAEAVLSHSVLTDASSTAIYGNKGRNGVIIITTKAAAQSLNQVQARKNLNETAFFFPNLTSQKDGSIHVSFTSPEALSSWKFRMLAHRKDASSSVLTKSAYTQKDLMVSPNFPRFFREGDNVTIAAAITNMTSETKHGIATLQLLDAVSGESIDIQTNNLVGVNNFVAQPNKSTSLSWKIQVPDGVGAIRYRIVAKSGDFSDGEENTIPVLTNNILMTESIPLWVREKSKREFTFDNLKQNQSATLKNHNFTLEYYSNPVWLVLQSLPYLMEFEHECAEQTFARLYANSIARKIVSSRPEIASAIEQWATGDESKLENNPELKSLILAETPWLRDSETDKVRKKRLSKLLSPEQAKAKSEACLDKLSRMQGSSGGFPWFEGLEENRYITTHILAGLAHLRQLVPDSDFSEITDAAIKYADAQFILSFQGRQSRTAFHADAYFWYMRSFYIKQYPLSKQLRNIADEQMAEFAKQLFSGSLNQKILRAITLHRFGRTTEAKKILTHLIETTSTNENWGMYWVNNKPGWSWHESPVETQALAIEAFSEITDDTKSIDAMKVWLIKNKQRESWPTTKSTTEAIYALLYRGSDWVSEKENTVIEVGDQKILTKKLDENVQEAASGYMKLNWTAIEITPEMGTITVNNKTSVPGIGGAYWQYFENLDKVNAHPSGELSMTRKMFLKNGADASEITSESKLKVGDLVTIQLKVTAASNLEFIHLKDMRASAFEPVDVISGYEYKNGIGFYKSTKDAATHYFFDRLAKGVHILEYDVRVNNKGDFSNGFSTIESMYAPEFSSHTKGSRVTID